MLRWFAVGALALVWGASCKSSTPSGSSGDDDDAGDDGGACSPCIISGVAISCGGADCVDGVEYQCSPGGEGAVQIGLCGDDSDDGGGDTGFVTLDSGSDGAPCMPTCFSACNIDDGCGNTCECMGDLVCNTLSNLCTNGCDNMAGAACIPGSTVLADCCIDDTQCATNDSGISTCCATTGVPGLCRTNGDCCGYPQVHCNTSTDECQ